MIAVDAEHEARCWTAEQLRAIQRRQGELLLDAGAGSGKTSVLVERFVRSVLEDGVAVPSILAITFTDKAAAELRERIRQRLRDAGADVEARATEGAYISTIHGFCARALRAHALNAGIDPEFGVLDEIQARRLADAAFDGALEELAAGRPGGVELIASYAAGALRGAIARTYAELRSRGQTHPVLPPLPAAPDLEHARRTLERAVEAAAHELGARPDPSARVVQALERLERCRVLVSAAHAGPGALDRVSLPGGNGAALTTPVCAEYTEALARFRRACEHAEAERVCALLDQLLRGFDRRYSAAKRAHSGLDFGDLELMTRDLLSRDPELRARYRSRFIHVMVDELQDTNQVQLELVELIAQDNLFLVGDAQQSIYAFRHADVELFERLGERMELAGARARLQTNFRSRPEILEVIDTAFAHELAMGDAFKPLRPGRDREPGGEPLVELLVADKASDWGDEGLAAPWRIAEARGLARRVRELIESGTAPREVVVLTRATTDLRAYERALEECGIPTYVIGGRGYWAHPQVIDMVAYLRTLANPRDEEALYTVLASPLLGVSLDALVLLAAAAREHGRDPWWLLREPDGALDELSAEDRRRLDGFVAWFAGERGAAPRLGAEELIERGLRQSRYDVAMLAMPGGLRRLANVRKLMRLGREYEAESGRDLRGFLELVRGRAAGCAGFGDAVHESEAPVEGEALDAVRLMTIHRAKGLEFETVCVADLGRQPWRRYELLRLGRDGRFGLRLAEPGTARPEAALDYDAIGEDELAAQAREERRLFYVAMTRARERLIVSGGAKLATWPVVPGTTPIAWVAPALMAAGVEPRFIRAEDLVDRTHDDPAVEGPGRVQTTVAPVPPQLLPPPAAAPAVAHLSYSSLGEYRRCGYRFYVERVLGIPPVPGADGPDSDPGGLSATDRGIIVHALLERLDFRRPVLPTAAMISAAAERPMSQGEAEEIAALIAGFAASATCERLGRASEARREERFSFLLGGEVPITGALDVLAREPGGRMLVVDYKSDRLAGQRPAELVTRQYAVQRLIYGLAALRAGADSVEVVHVFLEAADGPVTAAFRRAEAPQLERELGDLAAGVIRREFAVTEVPHRAVCAGCPAEGGLCSLPLEMTRRSDAERLF
jgi:ATP-dependent helicase/nuclease subunit A